MMNTLDDNKSCEQLSKELASLRSQLAAKDQDCQQEVRSALQKGEQKFRSVFDNASDPIYIADMRGQIVEANEIACKNLGYTRDELLKMTVMGVDVPDFAHHALRRISDAQNKDFIFESVHRRKDGTEFPVEINVRKIQLDGRPCALGVVRDISERKRAEEALRASEAEMRALFAAMTDLVFIFNSEGRYLKIVDTSPSLLYKPSNELLGKTFHEIFPKEKADFFLSHLRQALNTQQSVNFEYSLLIGGREFWFNATISPMSYEKCLMVARDITERKQGEEKLLKMNETLEHKVGERTKELDIRHSELKDLAHKAFIAMENDRRNLSKELHDSIGGTLAAIMYQMEYIREQKDVEPVRLEVSLGKVISCLRNAIRESRRITKKMRPSVLDDFGLIAAIKDHISEFQQLHQDLQINFKIDVTEENLTNDIGTVLYRVFQESLTNVGKHSGGSKVWVRLNMAKDRVCLKVKDNGVGFNPSGYFGPAPPTTTYGLHSMMERIEICKGEFRVESAPGEGTEITASIPLDPETKTKDTCSNDALE